MVPQTFRAAHAPEDTRAKDNLMGSENSQSGALEAIRGPASKQQADAKQDISVADVPKPDADSALISPAKKQQPQPQPQPISATAKTQSELSASQLLNSADGSALDGSQKQHQKQKQHHHQRPQQQQHQPQQQFSDQTSQLVSQFNGQSAHHFGQAGDQFSSSSSSVGAGQFLPIKPSGGPFGASPPTNGQLSSSSVQFGVQSCQLMDTTLPQSFRAPTSAAPTLDTYNFTTQPTDQFEKVVIKKKFKPSPKPPTAPQTSTPAPQRPKQASTTAPMTTQQSSFSSSFDPFRSQQVQLHQQQQAGELSSARAGQLHAREENLRTVASPFGESTTTTSDLSASPAFSLARQDLLAGQQLGQRRLDELQQQSQQFLQNQQLTDHSSLSGDSTRSLGQANAGQASVSPGATTKGAEKSEIEPGQSSRSRKSRKSRSEPAKRKSSSSLDSSSTEAPKPTQSSSVPTNETETLPSSKLVDDFFTNMMVEMKRSSRKPSSRSQANSSSSTTGSSKAAIATSATTPTIATTATTTTTTTTTTSSSTSSAASKKSRAPKGSLSRLFTSSSVDNNDPADSATDLARAFEELRDNTWNHLSKYVLDQAQQFDIPPLIGTLYTLRTENEKLANRVRDLTMKRDQLLVVNARLDLPGPLLTQHLNDTNPNFASVVFRLTNSPKSLPSPGSYFQAMSSGSLGHPGLVKPATSPCMPMAHSQPGSPYPYHRK